MATFTALQWRSWVLLGALTGCGGHGGHYRADFPTTGALWSAQEPAPPEESAPEPDFDAYGPGFDLVAFAVGDGPRLVDFSEGYVLSVPANGRARLKAQGEHLGPTKLRDSRGVVGWDSGAVYRLTSDRTLRREEADGQRTQRWHAPAEIEGLREEPGALWVKVIYCRTCETHREEIWRIPKRGAEPTRFYATSSELVTRFRSDGETLYLRVMSLAGSEWKSLGIPVLANGSPGAPSERDATSEFVDRRYRYEVRDGQLVRIAQGDGQTNGLAGRPNGPAGFDGTDVYLEHGNALYVQPQGEGQARLLVDWSGDTVRDACVPCGASLDALCLQCASAYYRVPRIPRPAGKHLVRESGQGLAVTNEAFYWVVGGRIVRRARDSSCGVYDNECSHVLLTLPRQTRLASPLIADERFVYYHLSDGSLRRLAQESGEAETLAAPLPPDARFRRPRRSIALDGDWIYFADSVRNRVTRFPRAGGAGEVLRELPRAHSLALGGSSLYVIAEAEDAPDGRPTPSVLLELDPATGELRSSASLPKGMLDIAATSSAVYVSFDGDHLLRVPRGGGAAAHVFPDVVVRGKRLPGIDVGLLAAEADTLYLSAPGRVLALRDGSSLPTVLASAVDGTIRSLVATPDGVYVAHAKQFKWKQWVELGVVPRIDSGHPGSQVGDPTPAG